MANNATCLRNMLTDAKKQAIEQHKKNVNLDIDLLGSVAMTYSTKRVVYDSTID